MDRRQRKTRNAIFAAFTSLLAQKDYSQITVEQIIRQADVGRATFYAHFETKEFLLRELCQELFAHVFEAAAGDSKAHSHIFDCEAPDSVFLHLFQHLQKDDNNILQLLSSRNNELFLRYFKDGLIRLVRSQLPQLSTATALQLPEDFRVNHIAATFVETVRWWASNGRKEPPEQITEYFLQVVENC